MAPAEALAVVPVVLIVWVVICAAGINWAFDVIPRALHAWRTRKPRYLKRRRSTYVRGGRR